MVEETRVSPTAHVLTFDRSLFRRCAVGIISYAIISGYLTGTVETILGQPPVCVGVCSGAPNDPVLQWALYGLANWLLLSVVGFAVAARLCKSRREIRFFPNVLIGIALLAFTTTVASFWFFEADDKWLAYRTSLNVLSFGYPAWNPEDPINVSTSLAWQYVASVAHLIGDWNTGVKGIGILCVLMLLPLTFFAIRDTIGRMIFLTTVLLYVPLGLWAVGGLETAPTVLYACVATVVFLRGGVAGWFALGGFVLWRPEMTLIGAGALLALLPSGVSIRRKLLSAVAYMTPISFWLAFNIALYGDPFPTSAYMKGFQNVFEPQYSIGERAVIGLTHIVSALAVNVLAILTIAYATRMIKREKYLVDGPRLQLMVGLILLLVYYIAMGYHHMNFGFRYYIPMIAMALLMASRLLSESQQFSRPAGSTFVTVFATAALCVQLPVTLFLTQYVRRADMSMTRAVHRDLMSVDGYTTFMRDWLDHGRFLRDVARKGDRLWIVQGQNLAGGALANIYSLDGMYAKFEQSSISGIRDCADDPPPACIKHFDYFFVNPNSEDFRKYFQHDERLRVVRSSPNLLVLKQDRRTSDGGVGPRDSAWSVARQSLN